MGWPGIFNTRHKVQGGSFFLDGDGIGLAEFFTGVATVAFVNVDDGRHIVNEFVDLSGTPFDALVTAGTFFFVDIYFPHY